MVSGIRYYFCPKRKTQPLYGWDADGRQFHYFYDALRRPVGKRGEGRLLENYIYGEEQPSDKDYNLRGQLYQASDGAGQLTHSAYDFKGNLLETARQLLKDPTIGDADWASGPDLSHEVFTTYATYDALSRLVDTKDPGGNIQEFSYDRGGYLKTVTLNGVVYVQDIHYDAKGQRQAIWYGNETKTSYRYDAATFRLRRLLTVNLNSNEILQDLNYWYDPVGNITRIRDEAQQTLFYANQLVSPDQDFTYDALYRLIEASGREQINSAAMGREDNWDDRSYQAPLGEDAAQNYTQRYSYDAVGNLLELKHSADVGAYTRSYGYGTRNNRLVTTEVGGTVYTYSHDRRGNMTAMPHLRAEWGLQNQMYFTRVGDVGAFYQYSSGERVRKYTDKGSVKEERIYLGSYEVYRKYDISGNLDLERTTVHVSDDMGRIAMLETRTQGSDPGPAELTKYIYSNHLQSAALELDERGRLISYEEYHPYGTTAYQASNSAINAVAKRYRFSGKERDEESGLYYHGARYYAPWLGRWTAVDPLESEYAPLSPYNYCFNNPVNFTDGSGMGPEDDKVKTQPQKDGKAPLEENYGPASSTLKMTPDEQYSFPYKWGGSVTKYHDDVLNRDYSVLEQTQGTGKQHFYSWVSKETGKAEIFTGYNKDIQGDWTGYWAEFESAEKRSVRLGVETADALTKGFIATGVGLLILPLALEAGVVSAISSEGQLLTQGTKWAINKYGKDLLINVGKQLAINDGDIKKVDFSDVALSTVNPFKKYGFAGRVFTEMINASVDFKGGRLYTMLPETNLWNHKQTSDVTIDFVYGYTKAGFKETFNTLGGSSPMRDFFVDYIAGKHKQLVKSAATK